MIVVLFLFMFYASEKFSDRTLNTSSVASEKFSDRTINNSSVNCFEYKLECVCIDTFSISLVRRRIGVPEATSCWSSLTWNIDEDINKDIDSSKVYSINADGKC